LALGRPACPQGAGTASGRARPGATPLFAAAEPGFAAGCFVFFTALGVGFQHVARTLPDVAELSETSATRVDRAVQPCPPRHVTPERGGPSNWYGSGHSPGVSGQGNRAVSERLPWRGWEVGHCGQDPSGPRVRVMQVGGCPVVDALASHPEHLGDISHGATTIEFQDGQCPAVKPRVRCLPELTSQPRTLPVT
jgi:hypothetical protein